jgi:pimeloyl-ACP methyl ester carboxylesterase
MQIDQLIIDGRRIEYGFVDSLCTNGLDLVMLHEGLGSLSMWRDFPTQLAQATGCRTLVYSRLGYGGSSALDEPRRVNYMHEEAQVWLPAILEHLGIRRPVLFGHSDGGSIALIHAAIPASDIAGVITLAPHVKVEDLSVRSIGAAKIAYLETDLRTRLSRYHADVDSAFWGWNQIWLAPEFRNWNIEFLLRSIRCPILAIQGENDEYGTTQQMEIIAREAPDSIALALPGCGHSPHRDQPQAVLGAAATFVACIAGNRSRGIQ